MDNPPDSFAPLLILARGSLSRADLARRVGCSERAIHFYERGQRWPKLGMLDAIMVACRPAQELTRRVYAAHRAEAGVRNVARVAAKLSAVP